MNGFEGYFRDIDLIKNVSGFVILEIKKIIKQFF